MTSVMGQPVTRPYEVVTISLRALTYALKAHKVVWVLGC